MSHKILKATAMSIISLTVVGSLGYGGYLYLHTKDTVNKTYHKVKVDKVRNVDSLVKAGKPISILLMGTDTGELGRTDQGRTDSLMVMTLNPSTHTTTMMSIPRDAATSIEGYPDDGIQKINAAYYFGGVKATMETVQKKLGVPIDYYALVNMDGLEQMVDLVGGVSVESPMDFQYSQDTAHAYGSNLYRFHKGSTAWEHSDDNGQTWSASKNKLTGDAALAFSRMRYDDPAGDYGRQTRQRLVLSALMKEVQNPSKMLSDKFAKVLDKNVRTDLSFDDLQWIALRYSSVRDTITNDHVQGKSDMIDGTSYEIVSDDEWTRARNVLSQQLNIQSNDVDTENGSNTTD